MLLPLKVIETIIMYSDLEMILEATVAALFNVLFVLNTWTEWGKPRKY
jgi:hypothetical protein